MLIERATISHFTGPQLVSAYNDLVKDWQALGGDNRFGTVKRFASSVVGVSRVEKLWDAVTEAKNNGGVEPAEPTGADKRMQVLREVLEDKPGEVNSHPEAEDEDEMAKKRKAKAKVKTAKKRSTPKTTAPKAARAPRASAQPREDGTLTIKQMTELYNNLVPAALKKGIKCHIHSSMFESREKGLKQLQKLQDAIEAE